MLMEGDTLLLFGFAYHYRFGCHGFWLCWWWVKEDVVLPFFFFSEKETIVGSILYN